MAETMHMGVLCLSLLGLSVALVCPDGGICEDKNTCCKNTMGGYGCCPLPHAECCSDHLHCCYEGTVCDLVHQKCVNKTVSLPWVRRLPTTLDQLVTQRLKAVICPDHKSECPDSTTCCALPDGSWGCCPLPKAVCCDDKRHCCPEETKCDLAHSQCVSASLESFPILENFPAKKVLNNPGLSLSVGSVMCPGGKTSCPDHFTCCPLASGDYGCCPYEQATCCSDRRHCCPSGTTCDLEHLQCKSGDTHMAPMRKKIPAVASGIVCPDRTTVCPDQTTCCLLLDGTYGCCPLPNAVCCSDHVHCCPQDTKCDLAHETCVSPQGNTPMVVKTHAAVMDLGIPQDKVHSVPCNESMSCADGNTCCKSLTGDWACCPLPKAVCCDDHLHCCPHGTICNLAASTCDDPADNTVTPLHRHVPAFPSLMNNNRCDESMTCPGKSTCCRTADGGWACCPLSQAVCCDDQLHCCPHDTICNLEAETCDDPSGYHLPLSWLLKTPALTLEEQDVKCDKRTKCPMGSTCCKRDSGQWACCPLPQAVCCNDHEHCCPKGYRCNVAEQTCDKPGDLSLAWLQKIPALQDDSSLPVSVPARPAWNMCDAQTSCARDTTCCFIEKTQKWGCCPLPNAVCCADHEHCCPQGYTCNMKSATCEKKNHQGILTHIVRQRRMLHSTSREAEEEEDVPCDGTGKFYCPKNDTCCRISATEWSCCPSPKAICCPDSKHCCPAGYSCDLTAGGCTPQSLLTWDSLFGGKRRNEL
ncbi:granulin b isoform 2-T2 [Pholidichthys leucotaenia]